MVLIWHSHTQLSRYIPTVRGAICRLLDSCLIGFNCVKQYDDALQSVESGLGLSFLRDRSTILNRPVPYRLRIEAERSQLHHRPDIYCNLSVYLADSHAETVKLMLSACWLDLKEAHASLFLCLSLYIFLCWLAL